MEAYREKILNPGVSRTDTAVSATYGSKTYTHAEVWRDVSGFTGLYEVSDKGQVRKTKSRRILHPFVAVKRTGRLYVDLYRDGAAFRRLVHEIVASAFVPQVERGTIATHRSEDYTDNSAVNLEWLTPSAHKARWFARNGERPRDADGRFERMSAALESAEAQAVHESAMGGWK